MEEFNLGLTLTCCLRNKKNQQVQDSDYDFVKTAIFLVTSDKSNFCFRHVFIICHKVMQKIGRAIYFKIKKNSFFPGVFLKVLLNDTEKVVNTYNKILN